MYCKCGNKIEDNNNYCRECLRASDDYLRDILNPQQTYMMYRSIPLLQKYKRC